MPGHRGCRSCLPGFRTLHVPPVTPSTLPRTVSSPRVGCASRAISSLSWPHFFGLSNGSRWPGDMHGPCQPPAVAADTAGILWKNSDHSLPPLASIHGSLGLANAPCSPASPTPRAPHLWRGPVASLARGTPSPCRGHGQGRSDRPVLTQKAFAQAKGRENCASPRGP